MYLSAREQIVVFFKPPHNICVLVTYDSSFVAGRCCFFVISRIYLLSNNVFQGSPIRSQIESFEKLDNATFVIELFQRSFINYDSFVCSIPELADEVMRNPVNFEERSELRLVLFIKCYDGMEFLPKLTFCNV